MSDDCIFCKIIAGELPSTKVYEDDHSIAFMDIGPVAKGHTLVIPKTHHDPLMETPDAVLHRLIVLSRRIAAAQVKGLGATAVNLTQANGALAGQQVPHIHFHVIPRRPDDSPAKNWLPGAYATQEEMETCASQIRSAIEP